MSRISREQLNKGPQAVASHPDFQLDWCKQLLSDPEITWTNSKRVARPQGSSHNAMFDSTLHGPNLIRAHLSLIRPCREPDAVYDTEECWLLSVGSDIDGAAGRAHGGFNMLILDQISGSVSHHAARRPVPPATATMTVDFKAPIATPCVLLLRAWIVEHKGRKIWVKAVLQNHEGAAYCTSKALFIFAKAETPRL